MCTVSTNTTEAKGVRLPSGLWRAIESEAASLDMSVSEFIRRKMVKNFSAPADVQNQIMPVQTENDSVRFS